MSTVTFDIPILRPEQLSSVDAWLRSVLWDKLAPLKGSEKPPNSYEIHRLKARLLFSDGSVKVVQGVRDIFEIVDGVQPEGIPNNGKMVIIGRGLSTTNFEESCLRFLDC